MDAILVPYDGWEASSAALRIALERGERYDARVDVVYVAGDDEETTEGVRRMAREERDETDADVECSVDVIEPFDGGRSDTEVGNRLVALIDDRGYDEVIAGYPDRKGRLHEFVVGSVTDVLLEDPPVPITLVPN